MRHSYWMPVCPAFQVNLYPTWALSDPLTLIPDHWPLTLPSPPPPPQTEFPHLSNVFRSAEIKTTHFSGVENQTLSLLKLCREQKYTHFSEKWPEGAFSRTRAVSGHVKCQFIKFWHDNRVLKPATKHKHRVNKRMECKLNGWNTKTKYWNEKKGGAM